MHIICRTHPYLALIKNLTFTFALLLLAACSKSEPDNLPPSVEVLPATNITRISATLNGVVTSHGGAVTQVLFRYGRTVDLERTAYLTPKIGTVSTMIDGLRHNTEYFFRLEAGDDFSLITSPVLSFTTERRTDTGSIWVETPGTLEQLFTTGEAYDCDTLFLSGKLNGSDLRFLRHLLGRDTDGFPTPGHVSVLDMTDVQVISGGESYDGMRFAQADTIGKGLFAGCQHLAEITLPASTTVIEADAFKDCISLKTLHLPGKVVSVEPSTGCQSLVWIDTPGNNEAYSSEDGVLFSHSRQTLVWFPPAITGDYQVPASVTSIGMYAFADSQCSHIMIHDHVARIAPFAFAGGQMESMVIPDATENLERGTFQGCTKLVSLTLGKETLFLSDYLFEGCPLAELHLRSADFVPHCEPDTFGSAEHLFTTCTLYVPRGCLRKYRNADLWSCFEKMVEE